MGISLSMQMYGLSPPPYQACSVKVGRVMVKLSSFCMFKIQDVIGIHKQTKTFRHHFLVEHN